MRYIDIDQLNLSRDWYEAAEQAKQSVAQAASENRAQVISQYSHVWRDLKDQLAELSFGKCWYCETKIERSDSNVDHFRPKAKVRTCEISSNSQVECRDVEGHDGYWWLAFDWRNYRYSCQYCNMRRKDSKTGNTGGKRDLFPLLDEGTRARAPDDDLSRESVALLDPTDPHDPLLLWFDQTGEAVPAPGLSDEDRKRVVISVYVYHLNYSKTKQARQVLYNRIESLVSELNRAIRDSNGQQQRSILRELRKYISPQAGYSVAARDFLKGLRSEINHQIIEQLLATA